MANNYTLGRGKVYFSRFIAGTETPEGFRYLGNTPEFSLTIESNDLDHFNSDEGIRELDDSVPLEVTRTGSLTTDNISAANVALFFFGSTTALTQASVAMDTETLTGIKAGHSYLLGVTDANPSGYMGLDPLGVEVELNGGTPAVAASGTITIASTGPTNGQIITIGGVAYTFRTALSTSPTVPNEIKTNATPATVAAAIADAINGVVGADVSVGTVYNPLASASDTGAVVTVTARDTGIAGNAIVFANTTPASNTTFAGTSGFLTGGTAGDGLVVGVDFTIDADMGMITFLEGSLIAIDGVDIDVSYAVVGSSRERVISGSSPVTGALLFVTKNPKGTDSRWLMNKVKMAPNGDYALKGDDWQQIPLSLSILKKDGDEAIYRDGVPTYA
jgi:hypothetical protein